MQIHIDGNGSKFFRFKNVRVSVKHAKQMSRDWEFGTGHGRYLQILAFRDAKQTSTFPGPQIPINDDTIDDEEVLKMMWQTLKAAT